MGSTGDIRIGNIRITRLWQHVLFWLAAYVLMVVIYGYSKKTYWIAARNNVFYAPVQLAYFYLLAYWLLPVYLFRQQYMGFFAFLLVLFLAAVYLTRIVDVALIDPYEIRVLGKEYVWYPPGDVTFWDKVFAPYAFYGALKGVNLVVWFGLAIKLFKLLLERKNAALQAELNFLKGQIHPHFLFNTLNNLYALTLNQSPKAPDVVLRLSDMMRYMLYECSTDEIALIKDIKMLKDYVELEKVRYEERLDFSFSINGEINDQQIAPLLLLTLVENAFKHGAGEKVGQAWISIDLNVQGEHLKFKVSNSKPENTGGSYKPGQIGLNNLKKRLEICYPDACQLKLFDEQDMFLAVLEIGLSKRLKLNSR